MTLRIAINPKSFKLKRLEIILFFAGLAMIIIGLTSYFTAIHSSDNTPYAITGRT
jgi:hypothetical protein